MKRTYIVSFFFYLIFSVKSLLINKRNTLKDILKREQGSIFRSENDIYSTPPPSKNEIFSPSRDMSFLTPTVAFLPSIFPILHLFYHFSSPFLIFFPFSSFFFPLSSFCFYIFCLFLLTFSYFFPQMTSADILPPPPPGGYVPRNKRKTKRIVKMEERGKRRENGNN
jgi:hypothetical protein